MGLYIFTYFSSSLPSVAVVWIQSTVLCLRSVILLNKKHNGIPDFDRVCSISEAVYCNWIVGAQLRRRGRWFRTLFKVSVLISEVWGVRNCS
jgi:hypothetical protein